MLMHLLMLSPTVGEGTHGILDRIWELGRVLIRHDRGYLETNYFTHRYSRFSKFSISPWGSKRIFAQRGLHVNMHRKSGVG